MNGFEKLSMAELEVKKDLVNSVATFWCSARC
jgi:hypothetical protein